MHEKDEKRLKLLRGFESTIVYSSDIQNLFTIGDSAANRILRILINEFGLIAHRINSRVVFYYKDNLIEAYDRWAVHKFK